MSPTLIPLAVVAGVWVLILWAVMFRDKLESMRRAAKPTGFRLGGETLSAEDWRVTGKRHGRPLTEFCVSRGEAEDAKRHMIATGYRGVRIERRG